MDGIRLLSATVQDLVDGQSADLDFERARASNWLNA